VGRTPRTRPGGDKFGLVFTEAKDQRHDRWTRSGSRGPHGPTPDAIRAETDRDCLGRGDSIDSGRAGHHQHPSPVPRPRADCEPSVASVHRRLLGTESGRSKPFRRLFGGLVEPRSAALFPAGFATTRCWVGGTSRFRRAPGRDEVVPANLENKKKKKWHWNCSFDRQCTTSFVQPTRAADGEQLREFGRGEKARAIFGGDHRWLVESGIRPPMAPRIKRTPAQSAKAKTGGYFARCRPQQAPNRVPRKRTASVRFFISPPATAIAVGGGVW